MRKTFLLIFVLLLMSIGGTALAQNTPTTFCGALSDADCTLLTQSATAMRAVTSAGFKFDMNINITDVPGSQPNNIGIRMTGNGAYGLDSTNLSLLLFSPDELAQNMNKLPQIMEDAIRAISADGNFLLFFSDEMVATMATSNTPLPSKAGFSMRLVGGTAYLNLDKLAQLDTQHSLPHGWIGFDLAAYYRHLLEQQSGALTTASPFSFGDASVVEKYITIERQPDSTAGDQAVAVFKTSLDMGALVGSDAFQTYLRQTLQQSAPSTGLAQSDLDQVMTLVQSLYNGLVIEATQSISLDDHYSHQITVSVNWPLDINALSSGFGGSPSDSKTPPVNIQFSLQADLSQFNSAPAVTAPEDATIIPLDQLNNLTNSFNFNSLLNNR